jgi:hypothetical protein
MSERRSLTQGLRTGPSVDTSMEQRFVYGEKSTPAPAPALTRVPLSTRIRADYAAALKRASLERQLQGVEPSTLQDMLEQALEPWLKMNGYLG